METPKTVGEANDKLKYLIDCSLAKLPHLPQQDRDHLEHLVLAEIQTYATQWKLEPQTYLDYYHEKKEIYI